MPKTDSIETVSLSTTIKNRLGLFKQALPTWVQYPFKNIYILNWNSDDTEELHEYVKSFNDDRIIIEDVFGKRTTYFMAAISRNMAAERCLELTKPKYLFQIDADIIVNESIKNLQLYEEIVYLSKHTKYICYPNWESMDSTTNAKNSPVLEITQRNRMRYGEFGTLLTPADKTFKFGYYNENFIENSLFDVYYISNFVNQDIDNVWYFRDEVAHIEHDNLIRTNETPEGDMVRGILINRALRGIPPYRYPYKVHERGRIEIN